MGAISAVGEFLIGWVLLPRIVFFLFGFIFLYFGFTTGQVFLFTKIMEAIIIIALFFWRKWMALGYLLDFLLGLLGIYALITGFFS